MDKRAGIIELNSPLGKGLFFTIPNRHRHYQIRSDHKNRHRPLAMAVQVQPRPILVGSAQAALGVEAEARFALCGNAMTRIELTH